MARFVSFIDDQWRGRVGLERDGEGFGLPAGLTLPVLLSLGADVVASLAAAAAARPAAGRTEALRLLPPVPNPGKILCLAGNYQEHVREGGGAQDEVGDGSGLQLTLDVNGERRQDGSTSQ